MAEEEEAKASPRLVSDVVSMVGEVLHLKSESAEKGTRGGPLLVVGRLYISLTLILAAVTSASAYLDTRLEKDRLPSCSVETMRIAVVACVGVGLILGVTLIAVLLRKHAMYLFSPTELSTEAQQSLLSPRSKEAGEIVEPPPPPPPPSPRPPAATPKKT